VDRIDVLLCLQYGILRRVTWQEVRRKSSVYLGLDDRDDWATTRTDHRRSLAKVVQRISGLIFIGAFVVAVQATTWLSTEIGFGVAFTAFVSSWLGRAFQRRNG
jgi:hypothetical protein